MAKAIGLIGNYTGKLGNTVGYNLKDSNNKQTQGVRVYQPVVKNPRTAGQAEQRAKLAPVNATYRLLKDIIDRGQEGVAYGNKSRLAWLKQTLKSYNGPWYEKGADVTMPVLCPISNGSLGSIDLVSLSATDITIGTGSTQATAPFTMGDLYASIVAGNDSLKIGDQLTVVTVHQKANTLFAEVSSITLDPTNTEPAPQGWEPKNDYQLFHSSEETNVASAIIVSREGDNGEHLRSSESLIETELYDQNVLDPAAKTAAIASYMSQGANTDWAEESIM